MFDRLQHIKLKSVLFFGAWFLFSIGYIIFQQSEFIYINHSAGYYKLISYVTLVALITCILMDSKYKKGEFYIYILLCALVGLIYLTRSNRTFLVYMLFMLAFKSVRYDFEYLIKFDVKIKLWMLIFVVSMSMIGVINNYSAIWSSGIIKYAYGFFHPNTLGILCFAILVEWLYLQYKTLRLIEWVIVGGIAFYIFDMAASRTSAYTFTVIFILFLLAKTWPRFYSFRITRYMFTVITPILALFSWYLVKLYQEGNAVAIVINTLTTARLMYASNFLNQYGLSLFGNDIEFVSSRAAQLQGISGEILDMAYIRGPILYGIVFSTVIFAGYMLLIYKNMKNELNDINIGMILLTTYYIILGFGETYVLNPIFCIPMLLIPTTIANIKVYSKGGI